MFSTRKNSPGGKNLERDSEKQAFALNLLVHGSSVPIHSQQPKTLKECKTCQNAPKEQKKKEFSFPVDKIIYLSERLELMSLTEKKIKAISLSAVNVDSKSSAEESEVENRSERNEMKLSSRVSTPGFDFSLDLSCISNTGYESDENCYPSERETFPHYNSESSSAVASEREGCETSRLADCLSQNRVSSFLEECEKPKSSSDLVNTYVNTVNKEKDLVRYFRTCRTCHEICCICPGSPSRNVICSFGNPSEQCSDLGEICSFNRLKLIEANGTCECESCPFFEKKIRPDECCCREIFDTDFFPPLCGDECGCRSDSDDAGKILTYTSSLASAAQSARDLARDLECILSNLNNETERRRRGDP